MSTTTALELSGRAARPQLYPVLAQGLTFAARASARREAEGRRRTWAYSGYDEDTPAQAGFAAGLAYGIWGVRPDEAEALGQLAGHLTVHAMRVLPAPRYIVTAFRAGDTATISVLARHGRPTDLTDPGTHGAVRRLADSWGTRDLGAGPCVFAAAHLTAAGRPGTYR
ncbi:hypothetical protein [Streptomyces sp. NBC_01207]|uniref:hypothetical protein n=1 Tax=Streptomyces sp. NBC_01207 TaxID=2903772 RepID=UPI002E0E2F7F|nr:hypothetical protein OG457_49715 [Streptomyces sp. NBC_01207]